MNVVRIIQAVGEVVFYRGVINNQPCSLTRTFGEKTVVLPLTTDYIEVVHYQMNANGELVTTCQHYDGTPDTNDN